VKKLITAADIKSIPGTGQTVLYMEPGVIITPSARDAAAELGITIRTGSPPAAPAAGQSAAPAGGQPAAGSAAAVCTGEEGGPVTGLTGISQELITRIVREVLAGMPGLPAEPEMVREEDPSGVRLVRGETVKCDSFNTGNPKDKVGLREIFTTRESPHMATGFMTIEDSAFSWDLKYEELDYVIEGSLDIIVNGKTYRGKAGDVFYIPKNTTVTFSTPDKAKFFFVTYPANWAELSNYQK